MEEIITVDGKQFRLTTDRPLSSIEKAQTIDQIRQQTGCGTCGTKRTESIGRAIKSLAACSTIVYGDGDPVTLTANPDTGTAPYAVRFWRKSTTTYTNIGTATAAVDGDTVSTSFSMSDILIAGALGNAAATEPSSVNTTTGAITDGATAATIAAGTIRLAVTTVDSCPTGAQTCVEWCDISLACPAPVCNFVVS
jgi:hypothetical protein